MQYSVRFRNFLSTSFKTTRINILWVVFVVVLVVVVVVITIMNFMTDEAMDSEWASQAIALLPPPPVSSQF
jgi:uncharacterized membrane protein